MKYIFCMDTLVERPNPPKIWEKLGGVFVFVIYTYIKTT